MKTSDHRSYRHIHKSAADLGSFGADAAQILLPSGFAAPQALRTCRLQPTRPHKGAFGGPSHLKNYSRRDFVKVLAAPLIIVGAASLAGCSNSVAAEQTDRICRVGMECAYAPYNWQTVTKTRYTIPVDNVAGSYADGYDVQISRYVCEGLGRVPVAVKLSFAGLISALNIGEIDLIIAGMSATPERARAINFSKPYLIGHLGLLVRKDSQYTKATSLADFRGAAVLGQKDTLLDTAIDEIPGVNHLTPVDSVPAQISRLNQGTCDAIVYNYENTKSLLQANPQLSAIKFAPGKGFKTSVDSNVGIRKRDTKILTQVNKILAGISEKKRLELWEAVSARQPH